MEIKFQILNTEQLLIQKFSGVFSFELYAQYSGYLMSSFNLGNINKVLIDFRQLKFEGGNKEFRENMTQVTAIRKDIHENVIKRTNIIHVFWVDQPLPTAVAQLFKSRFPHLNYNYCTTLEHVLANFNLEKNQIDLETIISKLEQTYQ